MISEKDKISMIIKITDDVTNYPPSDGDEVGYYAATINCIGLIAAFGEDQDAGN